jgi:hypothetical protein
MSGTRRIRIERPLRQQITTAAMEAFHLIRSLETQCTCLPRDSEGEYWRHQQCPACAEWYAQQEILCRELSLPPWRWPAVEHPQAQNPYPAGSPAAAWQPKEEARALWRLFDEAASERTALPILPKRKNKGPGPRQRTEPNGHGMP